MRSDFYATLAQVLPLLLLALIWDSEYLTRLRGQRRRPRRDDPAGVLFWTKPRVRYYTLTVAAVVIVSTGLTILELAGFVTDTRALRAVLSGGVLIVLATLLTHISIDIIQATAVPKPAPAPAPEPADGAPGPAGESG